MQEALESTLSISMSFPLQDLLYPWASLEDASLCCLSHGQDTWIFSAISKYSCMFPFPNPPGVGTGAEQSPTPGWGGSTT